MESPTKLGSIIRVSAIILLILLSSGCSPVVGGSNYDRDRMERTEAAAEAEAFQTATPPTNPDLRGEEFAVLMFVASGSNYDSTLDSIRAGVMDGGADLNTRGGVNGATIKVKVVEIPLRSDDFLDSVLEELGSSDPLVVLMAAPIDDLLYYEISHQDVPFLYFGVGGERFEPAEDIDERLFWLVPPTDDRLSFFVHSLWENWESVRPVGSYNELRIGLLEEKNDQAGMLMDEVISRLEIEGFEVPVRTKLAAAASGSVSNFLIDSVQEGVTVLYSDGSSMMTAALINDLGSLALEASFVTGGSIWSVDPGIEDYLLAGRDVDGYLLPISTAWWSEEENSAIQSAVRIYAEAGRSDEFRTAGYLLGLGSVDLIREVVQSSVESEESAGIMPEDVYNQLVRLEDYDVMGGLFIVDFTDGTRAPSEMRLWQFDGEKGWTPVNGWGTAP